MQSNPSTVPPEQTPSPIRVCKGPGCTHPIGPGRGPMAIYCSDPCNWRAQNAKKKLSRDAENPHRRTVRRLTPEEGQQVDQLLRELFAAGMPGAEVIETINRKMGLNCKFQTYFQRAGRLGLTWIHTPRAGRPWGGDEYLPEPKRAACYEDPAYEARNGIADRVICRECYAILCDGVMHGKRGHLWNIHQKDLLCEDPKEIVHRYRLRNPGVPIFTFQRMADQQHCDVIEYMAKEADLYVTPDVRAAADSDRNYEDKHMPKYVICRESRCGFKSVGWLPKHLESQHDITDVDKWRSEHNWATIIAPEAGKKKAKELSERNKRLRELAEIGREAWRPDDWWKKSIDWRIIGTELLSREGHMSNEELAERLDASRLLKCPYGDGESWGVITRTGRAMNYISEIRAWVNRPGGK